MTGLAAERRDQLLDLVERLARASRSGSHGESVQRQASVAADLLRTLGRPSFDKAVATGRRTDQYAKAWSDFARVLASETEHLNQLRDDELAFVLGWVARWPGPNGQGQARDQRRRHPGGERRRR